MSRDPYHDFANDLKASLSSARSLSHTYRSLLQSSSSPQNSEIDSAHDRLSDAIEGLRQDVEDVKQSVAVVEKSGPERFGVTPEELQKRRDFVRECEGEIKALSSVVKQHPRGGSVALGVNGDEDQDATEAFEREQQQVSFSSSPTLSSLFALTLTSSLLSIPNSTLQILMTRQDSTLDKIGTTLSSLQRQAGLMGQEIGEQIEIIDAFDTEVDQSQGRLGKAMRKMDEVVRISDERLGGWCVWILIVILFLLLLVVFLI